MSDQTLAAIYINAGAILILIAFFVKVYQLMGLTFALFSCGVILIGVGLYGKRMASQAEDDK